MRNNSKNLSLSSREEEILILASQGLTDRQIAAELNIRPGTINTHWSRIRLKLGAATRSEAVSILLKTKAGDDLRRIESEREVLQKALAERDQEDLDLRETSRLMKVILDNLPQVFWIVSADGGIRFVEGRMMSEADGGKMDMEARSAFVLSVVSEDDLKRVFDGREITVTREHQGKLYESRVIPVRSSRGTIDSVVGVTLDATFQKAAQETLLSSQRLLTSIVEGSPAIIHVHSIADNAEVFVNRSVFQNLGYTAKELMDMGRNLATRLIHPEDRETVERTKAQLMNAKDGEIFTLEYRMKKSDGNYVRVRDQVCVLNRNDDGSPKEAIGVAQVNQP